MKQTSKQWYLKFDKFTKRSGFRRREVDCSCYLKINDVVLIVGSNMKKINELKIRLTREFNTMNQMDTKLKKIPSMDSTSLPRF